MECKKEPIEDWYDEMKRQFKKDSETHDFSIPEEWDKEFRNIVKECLKKNGK